MSGGHTKKNFWSEFSPRAYVYNVGVGSIWDKREEGWEFSLKLGKTDNHKIQNTSAISCYRGVFSYVDTELQELGMARKCPNLLLITTNVFWVFYYIFVCILRRNCCLLEETMHYVLFLIWALQISVIAIIYISKWVTLKAVLTGRLQHNVAERVQNVKEMWKFQITLLNAIEQKHKLLVLQKKV